MLSSRKCGFEVEGEDALDAVRSRVRVKCKISGWVTLQPIKLSRVDRMDFGTLGGLGVQVIQL